MAFVTTTDGTEIFYKDWGPKDAQPVVFHHGWPLSSDDWDAQMLFFLTNGYRAQPKYPAATTWITTPPTPLLSLKHLT